LAIIGGLAENAVGAADAARTLPGAASYVHVGGEEVVRYEARQGKMKGADQLSPDNFEKETPRLS